MKIFVVIMMIWLTMFMIGLWSGDSRWYASSAAWLAACAVAALGLAVQRQMRKDQNKGNKGDDHDLR